MINASELDTLRGKTVAAVRLGGSSGTPVVEFTDGTHFRCLEIVPWPGEDPSGTVPPRYTVEGDDIVGQQVRVVETWTDDVHEDEAAGAVSVTTHVTVRTEAGALVVHARLTGPILDEEGSK